MNKEEKFIQEEIRHEFQLDRMILFSDAVFAIVITLMAIEIRVPHIEGVVTQDILLNQLLQLIPTILAYIGSFAFIGGTWYKHLKLFGLLKTYDGGLVVRNLLLLLMIGFFPFSASLVVNISYGLYLPIAIYFMAILACSIAQLWLQHYILVKRPQLRIHKNINAEIRSFRISRFIFIQFIVIFILITATFLLISNPYYKYFAWWWFFIFPFPLKAYKKRLNKKYPEVKS